MVALAVPAAAPAAYCPTCERDDQSADNDREDPVVLGDPFVGRKAAVAMQR